MRSFAQVARTLVAYRLVVYVGGLAFVAFLPMLAGMGIPISGELRSATVVLTLTLMGLTYGMELHTDGSRSQNDHDRDAERGDDAPRQRYSLAAGVVGIPPGVYLLAVGGQPVAGVLFLSGAFFLLHRSGWDGQ